jgi:hypothetical protein
VEVAQAPRLTARASYKTIKIQLEKNAAPFIMINEFGDLAKSHPTAGFVKSSRCQVRKN